MVMATKAFSCPASECSGSYTRLHDLKRHWLSVHKLPLDDLEKALPVPDKKQFVCDQCGHSFSRKDSLKNHQEKIHAMSVKKGGRFKCPYDECSEIAAFWQVQGLIKHYQCSHDMHIGEL